MTEDLNKRGIVLRVERSSIHDGDGFRTVIFLKGCPLRFQWCSTPESQKMQIEQTDTYSYGMEMSVEELMKEIRKDSNFYFISGGGVTVSGGELLAQPDFSLSLLRQCKRECLNTAIETSFFAPWATVSQILRYVDTAFVDLKLFDSVAHKRSCGADNKLILSNLLATNEAEGNFRLVVRTPIIPGINDTEAEMDNIGAFCAKLKRLDRVQLLPYHKLGTNTYRKMGLPYSLEGVNAPTPEAMERCRETVRCHIAKVI